MLNATLARVLAWDNHGPVVLSAQPVTSPAYLVIVALVEMVVLVVGGTDHIENQIVVNMPLINVGGKYKLVLATQYFLCHLYPNLTGFLYKYPLQRFSFPHSAPPLPMFRAGREHRFQVKKRLELASLYQRIRDSEINFFRGFIVQTNPSETHPIFIPYNVQHPKLEKKSLPFVSYFSWVIDLKSLHLTNLSIAKLGCKFLIAFMLRK